MDRGFFTKILKGATGISKRIIMFVGNERKKCLRLYLQRKLIYTTGSER